MTIDHAKLAKRAVLVALFGLAASCAHAASGGPPASSPAASAAPPVASAPPSGTSGSPPAGPEPQPSGSPPATSDAEWCAARKRTSQEGKHGVTGAIAELNAHFLASYTAALARACAQLESRGLVIRYAFNNLEARYAGKPLLNGKVSVTPQEYHPVKDISHAVILAALLFDEPAGAARDARVQEALRVVDAVARELADPGSVPRRLIPPALHPGATRIIEQTRAALAAFARGALDGAARKAYFARVRPDVEANLRAMSAAFVRQLHEVVGKIRAEASAIDPRAWDSVLVVIGITHQARAREIAIQYFQRLLSEPPAEGALGERRLVIAEGVTKASEQYSALAAHVLDQAGAALVFDDPLRLQSDLLSDSGGELDRLLPKPARSAK